MVAICILQLARQDLAQELRLRCDFGHRVICRHSSAGSGVIAQEIRLDCSEMRGLGEQLLLIHSSGRVENRPFCRLPPPAQVQLPGQSALQKSPPANGRQQRTRHRPDRW